MLNKKNVILLFLGLLLAVTFTYGFIAGTYQIFPYHQIKMVKNLVIGKSEQGKLEFPGYLHKTSFFKLNSQGYYDVVFIGDSNFWDGFR